jgi:hypothetical protein
MTDVRLSRRLRRANTTTRRHDETTLTLLIERLWRHRRHLTGSQLAP